MLFKRQTFLIIGASLLLTSGAYADEPTPPSHEQMQAVRDCAAKQGVELPPPPPLPPSHDGQGKAGNNDNGPPPPPPGGDHGPHRLTEEQKSVLDGCFKENGLEPPHGPHGSKPQSNDPQ